MSSGAIPIQIHKCGFLFIFIKYCSSQVHEIWPVKKWSIIKTLYFNTENFYHIKFYHRCRDLESKSRVDV